MRVFENRMLRRLFWSKGNEVTEESRKLNNEEHNDLYSSSNIGQLIISRIITWEGHVASMGR